jgi:hypothetical protein
MFRATRGNLYLRYDEVKKPLKDNDGRDVAKNVFIIFFQVTFELLRLNNHIQSSSSSSSLATAY